MEITQYNFVYIYVPYLWLKVQYVFYTRLQYLNYSDF